VRIPSKTAPGARRRPHGRCLWLLLASAAVVTLTVGAVTTSNLLAATPATLYASPSGTSTTCTSASDPCTVPEAVALATDGTYNGQAVTIVLAPGQYAYGPGTNSYPIEVSASALTSLSIQGAGQAATVWTTVDGDGALSVNSGTVGISGVGFDGLGGSLASGGAIANAGDLTLTDDTFNDDALNSSNAISGMGGGALSNLAGGVLTAMDDTFSGDQAGMGDGGSVYNGGAFTAIDDTFFDDSAGAGGGAVNNIATFTATDDTFANDTSSLGGALDNRGTAAVSNSIFQSATCSGPITDGGHNVSSDDSCGFGAGSVVDNGDINLATALAPNGSSGPETLAISEDSSAFEEVPAANCTVGTDERDQSRPGLAGQGCDAGAFELQIQILVPATSPPPTTVPSTLILVPATGPSTTVPSYTTTTALSTTPAASTTTTTAVPSTTTTVPSTTTTVPSTTTTVPSTTTTVASTTTAPSATTTTAPTTTATSMTGMGIPPATSTTLGTTTRMAPTSTTSRASTTTTTTTVKPVIVITRNPRGQIVRDGTLVVLRAAARAAARLRVQWQVATGRHSAFVNLPWATKDTLAFVACPRDFGHRFRAVFSAGRSSATTDAASLAVIPRFFFPTGGRFG